MKPALLAVALLGLVAAADADPAVRYVLIAAVALIAPLGVLIAAAEALRGRR